MVIPWTRCLIATIAVTAGTLGGTQLPALAARAATPVISISVQAPFDLNNLTFVAYRSHHSSATVFGTVTFVANPEVVRLYAQQFPYTKPAVQAAAPITIQGAGTGHFSFRNIKPTLATRYQAELFADSTATTPLATSPVAIIYVAAYASATETHRCPRPDCTAVVHVKVVLPAQAMRAERPKKIYTYFAVSLSPTHIPPPPRQLYLGAGHPRVTRTRKISADEYTFSITFTFRVGNDAYYWRFNLCTKDTLAADGLGLPGHHSCGDKRIPAGIYYLG